MQEIVQTVKKTKKLHKKFEVLPNPKTYHCILGKTIDTPSQASGTFERLATQQSEIIVNMIATKTLYS